MKHFLFLFILCFAGQVISGQEIYSDMKVCPQNPDSHYDRRDVLIKLSKSLERSVQGSEDGFAVKKDRAVGFIVFDLTDPLNDSHHGDRCVDFNEGHVYHFSPISYDYSQSSIAILQNGEIKMFERVNCGDIDQNLRQVLSFLKSNSNKIKDFENTFNRTANYRRYGRFLDVVERSSSSISNCAISPTIPLNSEGVYDRYSVFRDLEKALIKHLPRSYKDYLFLKLIENEMALGFYIQDLTDPGNKQTNLLERVEFKEDHVYMFGWIDAPYSISHIAVLKNSDINLFEAIDCRADGLTKVRTFINNNFPEGQERGDLLKRIDNYKNYRFSIPFGKKSRPQCK